DRQVLALRRLPSWPQLTGSSLASGNPDTRASYSLVQLVFHLESHFDSNLPSHHLVGLDHCGDVLDVSAVDAFDRDACARDCQLHGLFDRVGRDARELDRFFNHDAQPLLGTPLAGDCLTFPLAGRYARPCVVVSARRHRKQGDLAPACYPATSTQARDWSARRESLQLPVKIESPSGQEALTEFVL